MLLAEYFLLETTQYITTLTRISKQKISWHDRLNASANEVQLILFL